MQCKVLHILAALIVLKLAVMFAIANKTRCIAYALNGHCVTEILYCSEIISFIRHGRIGRIAGP